MRLIAGSFAILGVGLGVGSVRGLLTRMAATPSAVGAAILGVTVAVMFSLTWGKRRTGAALQNRPLMANASMTFIDGCVVVGLLVALAVDRIAGMVVGGPLGGNSVALIALNKARASATDRDR